MAKNDIRGSIDLDATPAITALSKAKKAFRDLSNASTDASKEMTASQRAAAKAVIAEEAKMRAARDKTVKAFRESNAKIRRDDLNAQNARKVARMDAGNRQNESASKVALTNAKALTEEERRLGVIQDNRQRKALGNSRKRTEEARKRKVIESAANQAAESAERQELTRRKQITEQIRQQMLLQEVADRKQRRHEGALTGMRYALYDVSGAARAVGIAGLGAAVGVTAIAVSWEKSFAEVQRTSKVSADEVGFLKAQFVNLVQTLPISWEKLTEIGTLAGQLGIAKDRVADFTKTTAMFSATTGVSVEDTATAFGRLDALIPSVKGNYQGLANSILKVGTNSVATEGDIINITGQLASIAGPAGYSYDQIIGLSGALASVGAPPELSRGTIQRAFGKIGAAVSEGGIELDKWAKASGMTAKQFADNWDKDASGTFTTFMGNLAAAGSGADGVLKELGITSVRDVPLLKKLAGAADATGKSGTLLKTSLEQAANATGELQRQYGVISNTSGAKIQVLFQNILALLDKIGSSNLGMLNDVISDLTSKVQNFTASLDEPARLFDLWELPVTNAQLLGFGVVIAGVVGALGLLIAGIGRVSASFLASREVWGIIRGSMLAHREAIGKAAASNATFAVSTDGVVTALDKGTKSSGRFKGAIRGLGSALAKAGPGLALTAVTVGAGVLLDLDKQAREAGTGADEMANGFLTAKDSLSLLNGVKVNHGGWLGNEDLKPFITDIDNLGKGLDHIGKGGMWNDFAETAKDVFRGGGEDTFANITTGLTKMDKGFEQLVGAGNVKVAKDQMEQLISSAHLTDDQLDVLIERMPAYKRELTNALNGQELKATDENLRKAARGGVSEMTDAMAELAGVSKDAVTQNFGGSSEAALKFMDSIDQGTLSIYDMNAAYQTTLDRVNQKGKEAWVKAGKDVSDYTDVATVNLDDFLTTMDQQIATAQERYKNLAKIAVRGGQDAAVEAAKYGPEMIKQLAESSGPVFDKWLADVDKMSKDSMGIVDANIASLTPEVIAQFKELGGGSAEEFYTEISKGTRSIDQILDDLRKDNAGKPVRLTADTRPAAKDINDFKAAQTAGSDIDLDAVLHTSWAQRQLDALIRNNDNRVIDIQVNAHNPRIGFGLGDGHATGGYISGPGTGTSDSIPARLSNGEFVFTAAAVRNIGVGNLYDLMRSAQRGFATGGLVTQTSANYVPSYGGSRTSRANSGGVTQVELSPFDRQLLAQAGNVVLRMGNKVVAQAVNSANSVATKRGSN